MRRSAAAAGAELKGEAGGHLHRGQANTRLSILSKAEAIHQHRGIVGEKGLAVSASADPHAYLPGLHSSPRCCQHQLQTCPASQTHTVPQTLQAKHRWHSRVSVTLSRHKHAFGLVARPTPLHLPRGTHLQACNPVGRVRAAAEAAARSIVPMSCFWVFGAHRALLTGSAESRLRLRCTQ